jgi:tetratricopeptide (TPR) repeat protein
MAVTNLKRALEDRSMPIQEVDDACRDIFLALERNHGAYEETYRGIERLLFQNWPNESVPWFIKGKFYTKFAWIARGGGYADTVTEAGWKLMAERLKEAEAALLRAWQLNPKDPRIATAMITVELGQGRGKAHMESWFERAMEVDPNNFEACEAKRYYLEPKWHGSTLEMLAFGRECVRSTQWGGRVPLVLVDAHEALARYLDEEDRPEYWLQPQVWHDLKSAYDKFFELNPNATGWRHNYARHAYQCGKWAVFLDMLPSLGSVNYDFFGGQTEFESMVRSAREHVSDQ